MADSKKYNGSTWQHSLRKLTTATETITTLPADLYADGNSATVGLVGNMSQAGTPTPQNPIQPQECGERTGNLFDGTYTKGFIGTTYIYRNTGTSANCAIIPCEPSTTYTVKKFDESNRFAIGTSDVLPYDEIQLTGVCYVDTATTYTFTTNSSAHYIVVYVSTGTEQAEPRLMINVGQPMDYQPYGYKIPISSASTTTPVYLDEVESTRRIKKLVFDGTENWNEDTSNYYIFIDVSGRGVGIPNSTALSTHTESGVVVNNNGTALFFKKSVFVHSSLADFKTYLQQQYAAGTPVTIWYVLATPTTGIINEPLRKIGDYADEVSGITIPTITGKDTFDVLTTLKPSEVELTYTGWHDATVKEWDGSQWQ